MATRREKGYVMISIVAERYNIHPQTLRLYEREGLLKPARTGGNTRLYGPDELRRLELILRLTRDLGVNLAGVEVILNLHKKMEELEMSIEEWMDHVRQKVLDRRAGFDRDRALVRIGPSQLQKIRKK